MDMSTLKELITSENIEKGVNLITGAGVTKVLKSSKTFNNLWDITIGNRLDAWNQKSIFKNQQDVEKYKNDCLRKFSEIPEEKFQNPKLSIVGPALEASKFYIEEEEIRNLFSNLIASSMNSDFNNIIHHSFVEIIKQMNPLDAKIINSINNTSPIVNIISVDSEQTTKHLNLMLSKSCLVWCKNLYFSDAILESFSNNISIDNLIRLGLIAHQENELSHKNLYNHFYNSEILKNLKIEYPDTNFQLQKFHIRLTNLGNAFKTVCCDSD